MGDALRVCGGRPSPVLRKPLVGEAAVYGAGCWVKAWLAAGVRVAGLLVC